MSVVVAEREFRRADTGTLVTTRVHAPVESSPTIWSSRIEIVGLSEEVDEISEGVDSFQALYLALVRICFHLRKFETVLTFQGRPNASIPIVIPWDFGPALRADVYEFARGKMADYYDSLPPRPEQVRGGPADD